jgi:hypothetical protein
LTTVKIAAVAPMPSANVRTAAVVKRAFASSVRAAKRKS